MQSNQHKIKREVALRGISQLYHFTPAENSRSILCNGLASTDVLQMHNIDFFITDTKRLDEQLDAVSLSIHSINESMFKAKMRKYKGEWLIFELDASILWTHSCRFCWDNAATTEIRRHGGFLGGIWGFTKMFEDRPVSQNDGTSYRSRQELADCQPTNIGAEVQVFDPIDPELIVDVTVTSANEKKRLEALMQDVGFVRPVEVCEEFFIKMGAP